MTNYLDKVAIFCTTFTSHKRQHRKRKTSGCSMETMKSPSPIIAHESAPASQCSRGIETNAPFDSAGWLMDSVLMAPQAIRLCSVRAMGNSGRTLFISQE
ncbi:hypothetical protein CDAR_235871 [Caerostris darwini]|uniref:Uncharacterized protein n=1 Tax=Caerostris darwini TaxID=1538125 RepID=A0AAV4PKT7_9ARAC|nr:hypothetical protein CDAR_235871 [Caerostris darwini]